MDIKYLVEKYNKLVYKICINMLESPQDAEDLTQEVFLSLYKNLSRYRNLQENEMKNLICKIALNKCMDMLKSKSYKFEKNAGLEIIELENYKDNNDIDSKLIENEKKNYINKIINELKEPYREIIKCYYIDQLTLDELALKLNVPKSTLKVQIYRGKKLLKEKIKESGGESFL